uniref:CMP/dCMP-type deaminase domain-containing protein n=1 Tax=Lates calcarifer TaxID=8187 RepID=A0A4W6F1T4_LATCA
MAQKTIRHPKVTFLPHSDTQFELQHISQKAKEFSYCPYSQLRVGSALLTEDEKIFTVWGHTRLHDQDGWILHQDDCGGAAASVLECRVPEEE